jgi:cephalosporin hydroxylase
MQTLNEIYHAGINSDKGTIHSYIDYYEELFKELQNKNLSLLEIGIYKGESLRMWSEYFAYANIIGVDIREYLPLSLDRCTIIYGDATKIETFSKIDNLDIIIDDGEHTVEQQLRTFEILFPKLNAGGLYIIEDIADLDSNKDVFLSLYHNIKIHDFRNLKHQKDDVIIEIQKDK